MKFFVTASGTLPAPCRTLAFLGYITILAFEGSQRRMQKLLLMSVSKVYSTMGRRNRVCEPTALLLVHVLDQPSCTDRRIDKYGRKISSKQRNENLRRFYRQDKEDTEPEGDMKPAPDYARGVALMESSDEEEEESAESDVDVVVLGRHVRKRLEHEQSPEIDLNEDVDVSAGEQPLTDSSADGTKKNRLAIVNLDWDHVKATHLYKIVSSLVSPTGPTKEQASARRGSSANPVIRGSIVRVRVYPSKFGAERMKKEEIEGPPKELFKTHRAEDLDEDEITAETLLEQEDSEDENEALRKYQLERLRSGCSSNVILFYVEWQYLAGIIMQ